MVRNMRRFLNLQIRFADRLGWRRVQPSLRTLKTYWLSGER